MPESVKNDTAKLLVLCLNLWFEYIYYLEKYHFGLTFKNHVENKETTDNIINSKTEEKQVFNFFFYL